MSHRRAKLRGHNAHYPRGHGRTGSCLDGRLATDIVEAAWVIKAEKAREKRGGQPKKVAPITLAIAPWGERVMKQDVKVGTELFVPCKGRGGHGAFVIVERVLARTYRGIERERSYHPGTKWTVHHEAPFAICRYHADGRRWLDWRNDG